MVLVQARVAGERRILQVAGCRNPPSCCLGIQVLVVDDGAAAVVRRIVAGEVVVRNVQADPGGGLG